MMYAKYDLTGTNVIGTSYYYAIDRMYNVRYLLDSAGAIVESYACDPYGKPLIRECAGRGDMTGDSIVSKDGDEAAFLNAMSCTTFDPRADVDDDGDVDRDDAALYDAKIAIWDGTGPTDVKTARSLIGNPYMFQGRPHFVAWTDYVAEHATLMLNEHRNRFADPMTGRWLTRDPIGYLSGTLDIFEMLASGPTQWLDPFGLSACSDATAAAARAAAALCSAAHDAGAQQAKINRLMAKYRAIKARQAKLAQTMTEANDSLESAYEELADLLGITGSAVIMPAGEAILGEGLDRFNNWLKKRAVQNSLKKCAGGVCRIAGKGLKVYAIADGITRFGLRDLTRKANIALVTSINTLEHQMKRLEKLQSQLDDAAYATSQEMSKQMNDSTYYDKRVSDSYLDFVKAEDAMNSACGGSEGQCKSDSSNKINPTAAEIMSKCYSVGRGK